MHDLVIRGGRVVDGTGAPAFTADVAIDGGVVSEVGKVGAGRREIDADGLLVTPGFVDIHTHFDAQVTWDPYLTPSSWHGCTTVVMGNCGVGFAPVKPDRHEWLIGLMEGVEDIPGSALTEGIEWGWESFPEYLDAIERSPHAIDFGTQIPHGALRAYVMGDRGAANEDATADDIGEMYTLVRDALEAGALGFSTSRTMLHKAIDGRPVPGTFAAKDELFGIGRALGDAGHGVFQLAAQHEDLPTELEWMCELSRRYERTVMFNLSQIDQQPDLWRESVRILDAAHAEGLPVFAQAAGRAIGILMSWQGTAHPFAAHAAWLEMQQMGWAEKKARLQSPELRARLINGARFDLPEFETFVTRSFDKMYPLAGGVDYEPDPRDSVAAIAARTGKDPEAVAFEHLLSSDGDAMLYFPLFNYTDGNLDVLHALHSHPQTRMGLSDAGAHCGAICDGGMPTFMLTHWTRDRTRGEKLPLEHVVRRQTSETARAFGLDDRGILAPGMKADVNVIDYEHLAFEAPRLAWDLPAGGRRLIQRANGYRATVCTGEIISEHGEPTGAMPGHLVRGPQSAS